MNRQILINKFIEKAGPLDPKPQLGFIQGTTKYYYGLTTQLTKVFELLKKEKNLQDVTRKFVGEILPSIRFELNNTLYTWDETDILACSRMLQNKPFSKVNVIMYENQPVPIAFHRSGCDISILLAPYVNPLPKYPNAPKAPRYIGNPWTSNKLSGRWIKQMPNSTFWLVEFDTIKDTVPAFTWGYPIGRMLICYVCKTEIGIEQWPSMLKRNHPECMCQCNTYDDFCGCMRKRELQKYDRLWRQVSQTKRWRQIQEKKWADQ
jgi:hypothetical protein